MQLPHIVTVRVGDQELILWRPLRGARLRGCLGGFGWLVLRARTTLVLLPGPFYRGTCLSGRRGRSVTTPHGSAYCKGPRGRRVGSPAGSSAELYPGKPGGGWWERFRSLLSLFPHFSLSLSVVHLLAGRPLGLRPSLHSGSSQQGPAPRLVLAPSASPRCSPIFRSKTRLYR